MVKKTCLLAIKVVSKKVSFHFTKSLKDHIKRLKRKLVSNKITINKNRHDMGWNNSQEAYLFKIVALTRTLR